MNEIERRFLVKHNPGSSGCLKSYYIEQSYISSIYDIRIRMEKSSYSISRHSCEYMMIIKSLGDMERELEKISITRATYVDLLNSVKGNTIIKLRKKYQLENDLIAEWDKYQSIPDLQTVEVEFKTKEEADLFIPPNWFGEEITNNPEYKNINLAKR